MVAAHNKTCGFIKISCSHADCKVILFQKEMETHASECPNRSVECVCKNKIKFVDFESHKQNECPETEVGCGICGDNLIKRKDTDSHKNICPMSPVTCPHEDCKHPCLRNQLESHLSECIYEKIKSVVGRFSRKLEAQEVIIQKQMVRLD
jgi:hypothetical protein